MPFRRDSLAVVLDRVYANYVSLFKPFDKTPRQNLLKVFSTVDAGIYHQLLGDLDFLSRQIFPDTAEGEILREHWSGRVTPLYASGARGDVLVKGTPGKTAPAGIVFQAANGERYYTEKSYKIGSEGSGIVNVKSEGSGLATNLAANNELSIVSSIPQGIDSKATVTEGGVLGGADAESDEEYLVRILSSMRNPFRYGKRGDYAAWALDATPEVSRAWEYKNFGVFGALLVQVINGNQVNGVYPVQNLAAVSDYISAVSPPVIFTVRTPALVLLNPSIKLPPHEDTLENRELAETRLKLYLQHSASPGCQITSGAVRMAIIDGVAITDASVKLADDNAGIILTTILEYPVPGEITWE